MHSTGKVTLFLMFRVSTSTKGSHRKVLEITGTHKAGSSGLLRPSFEAFESFVL